MKSICTVILLILLLWGCSKKTAFKDTTKEERNKALTALKHLDSIPEKTFRNELVSMGSMNSLDGDLHQYKLQQSFHALATENCFNLFKSHNNELARSFEAMTYAPRSVVGQIMADIIDSGVSPGVKLQSNELQMLPPLELKKRLLEEKQITEKDLYCVPHNYLRFVLFLDSQIRPQLKEDALYQHIRKQILESRPRLKRGAGDILELQIKGDSLFAENNYMGPLSDIGTSKESKTLKRFDEEWQRFNERHEKREQYQRREKSKTDSDYSTSDRDDRLTIAPDFYAKEIKKESITGNDRLARKDKPALKKSGTGSKKSSDANNGRSRVVKKGILSNISGPITSTAVADADPFGKNLFGDFRAAPTPLMSVDIASIIIDTATSQRSLLKLIEHLPNVQIQDISLTSTNGESALFRVHARDDKNASDSSEKVLFWNHKREDHATHAVVQGLADQTATTIVHFKKKSISPQEFIRAIGRVSDDRNNTICFDTSGHILTLHDTQQYRIPKRVLLGKEAFSLNPDPFGKGGPARGIEVMLAGGAGGLRRGDGEAGIRRGGGGKGSGGSGMGFGIGTGSGFGGGSGGVDLSTLSGDGTKITTVKRKKIKRVKRKNGGAKSAGMSGGRSRANIMRTVRNNMTSLKYAYNSRLKVKPGVKGKVVVKWAIDEFGNVLHCRVVSSTMKDPTFEKVIVNKIKRWAFGKIPIPGDVTEVTYPFVFTE